MTPALHAAADRVFADGGYMLYLAGVLPAGALDARPPRGGWDVRTLLAHVAATADREAAAIEGVLAGRPLLSDGFDLEQVNASVAEAARGQPLDAIVAALRASRTRLLLAISHIPAAIEEEAVDGPWTLRDVVTAWALHYQHHALDIVEAVPALAGDAMIALWVFGADYDAEPPLRARQRALLKATRPARTAAPHREPTGG